jgi:heavy metal sensor kinase
LSSFRSRIRLSALLLIGTLLVAFSILLYSGLSVILHRYLDTRLLAFGEAWAVFIEDTTGSLPKFAHDPAGAGSPEEVTEEHRELREVALSITVLSADGRVAWRGPAAHAYPALSPSALSDVLRGETVYDTIRIPDAPSVRRIALPVYRNGAVRYILQAESKLRFIEHALRQLAMLLVVISISILALAWVGSRWVADQALTPVEALSSTAERISGSSLKTRVSLDAPYAEFQRLAQVFNAMLERLQHVFEAQRRFIADAAHELKTPLTIIKGNVEVALKKDRSAEEYREVLIGNLAQVERLISLTRTLLMLSQFAGDRPPIKLVPLALEPMLKELTGELAVLAEDRRITLALEAQPVPPVLGCEGWLRHLVINLMDNALRHTPPGGIVKVRLGQEGEQVAIKVTDTGPGIPPEHLPHLFERFYRAESARDRESGGVGLGLAIVNEIAEAHGGTVRAESEVGKGSSFTVTLLAAQKLSRLQ